jgi:hypothetical protein
MEIDPKKITEGLTEEQREQVLDYQKVFSRLSILKNQMSDIQEETTDLLEVLEKMRIKNKQ